MKTCETQILNTTCDKPVITNHDGNVANEARPQLNSDTTPGQYLDFSGGSAQPHSRSDNTKRSKRKLPEPRSLNSPD